MSKKRKSSPGDLKICVMVTVRADPGSENCGTCAVELEIDGPETVVAIVRAAYERGDLNRGIDAFTAAALRPITEPRPASPSRIGGRA